MAYLVTKDNEVINPPGELPGEDIKPPEEENPGDEVVPPPETGDCQQMIMAVVGNFLVSMEIVILYDDNRVSKTIINENDVVEITYIKEREKCTIVGKIDKINKDWLEIDLSKEYESNTAKVLIANIRAIKVIKSGIAETLPL